MTPIFYNLRQSCDFDFPSYRKIPMFVRQAARPLLTDFEPLKNVELITAHSIKYVVNVFSGKTPNGFGNTDPVLNETLRYTNANFLAATQHVAEKKAEVACSATQGFHHAGFDSGGGYCTFNGLMIAALSSGAIKPALIFDGDGHYGDGTDDIIGALAVHDRVRHVTNMDMESFVSRYKPNAHEWEVWASGLISSSKPSIIMYQAGADAWIEDPYGAGYLSLEGMRNRDLGIFRAAKKSKIPLVWNLAGGYCKDVQRTVDVHIQTLRASDEVYYGGTR